MTKQENGTNQIRRRCDELSTSVLLGFHRKPVIKKQRNNSI